MTKGSAASLATIRLSAAELGGLVGVSERRVREMRDEGIIASDDRGRYGLDCVTAYCTHIRPASGKAASGGSDGAAMLDAARVRLVTAQADARELLNAQLRGDAVLAEDLEAIVGGTFDAVRAKVLAVPVSAAARVVGLADRVSIQEVLTGLVHDALADLADAEVVGTVKDRARRRAGRMAPDDESASE